MLEGCSLKIILITSFLVFGQMMLNGEAQAAPDPRLSGGSGSPASVFVGAGIDSGVFVQNTGDAETTGLTLQFNYSLNVNSPTTSASGVICSNSSPNQVTCTMSGSMLAGGSRFVTIRVVTAQRGSLGCNVVLNTTGEDSDPTNNTRTIPDLEVREWGLETVFGLDPLEEGDPNAAIGEFAQIALGLNELPLVSSYLDVERNLIFFRRDGSGWDNEMVIQTNNVGRNSRFAASTTAAGESRFHFIFTRMTSEGENPLRYVQTDLNGQPSVTYDLPQAQNNNFRDLVLDASGSPNISYPRGGAAGIDCFDTSAAATTSVTTANLLIHSWYNGTAWRCARVTTGPISGPNALAIASDGRGHSAYIFENSEGDTALGYRRSAAPTAEGVILWRAGAGSFSRNRVLGGDPAPTAVQLSIATDGSNRAHICLYDPVGKQLLYFLPAVADGALPAGATVDGTASSTDATDVGQFCDITVRGDLIHISYYDAENKALKYAWKTLSGLAWSKTIVDDAVDPADVGQYPSIAVDSKGFVHIGYYDATNQDLKYAVTAGCGSWRVDSAETCDDGNTTTGDGCSATCQTEAGGGGGVCNNNGTCDAGETNATCPADCPLSAVCPNGVCESGENNANCAADCPTSCGNGACDPGETNATCPADCPLLAVCPNGVCETGEDSTSCVADCPTSCGNGACDNSETNATCARDCPPPVCDNDGTCEAGENNQNCAQDCPAGPVCGNNQKEGDEQCDDGNMNSGDGCSATCRTEGGGGPVCGNGSKESGEECDDGNTTAGDGCSAACRNETLPPPPTPSPIVSPPGTGKPARGGCSLTHDGRINR
ncbi:MAG: DUF4215 domain-containing protein [Deltaproteobacteria bacterium]|nr:DUF4215 domain-containing protein [Deltaproteobacteria bacterium]